MLKAVHAIKLPFHLAAGKAASLVSHDVKQPKSVVDARAVEAFQSVSRIPEIDLNKSGRELCS